MALIKTPSTGTEFFKAKDHEDKPAILFEPLEFIADKPSQFGPRDVIIGHFTIFTQDALDGKVDPIVMTNAQVEGAIVNTLKQAIGNAMVSRITKGKAKPGKSAPWILVDADDKNVEIVSEYYEKRGPIESAPRFEEPTWANTPNEDKPPF